MRMCKTISKVVMSIPLPARILAKCKDTQTEDQTVSACLSVTLAHQLTLIFFGNCTKTSFYCSYRLLLAFPSDR